MCFGSRKSDSGEAHSRDLDRIIRQDERRLAKEVKLLLLGEFCSLITYFWTFPPSASLESLFLAAFPRFDLVRGGSRRIGLTSSSHTPR